MSVLWPLVKILFNVVGPNISDVVKTVADHKRQYDHTSPQGDRIHAHVLDLEHKLAQHLELIDSLTKQLELVHHLARKALIVGCLAVVLALIAAGTVFLTR